LTPRQMTADARAQRAALFQYASAHDRFCEIEQVELARGHVAIAIDARHFAQRVLDAWLAERDDPEPERKDE
jgi:hypothetical protein